ncbi:uncharacterized protein [Heliangelus exortis]|uniref:uncharacterized protein n=1 Tax=Heliangelus exortis TaxID=472823 RepID=UPI003A8F33BD
MEGLNRSFRHSQLTLPSQEGGGFNSCLKIPEKQGVSPPRGAVGRDPGRRSGAPGLPVPPRLRLRLRLQLTRRLLTKWRRPWKRQPHFVPGRACQQNADLAKAEEQKAAARLRYRERREESEGFHRPPAAERRLSIKCARWGREKREVKGDASSQRVRGCLIPVRSCRSCGAGEGKAKADADGLGAAPPLAGAQLADIRGLRRRGTAGAGGGAERGREGRVGRRNPGLPGRGALLSALALLRSPGGRDPSCRIPTNVACLMNKPAIRLMLQVTLSSTKMSHGILMALPQSWFAFPFLVWKCLKRFKRCCCSGMKLELSPCVHEKPEDCFVKLHQRRIFSV